MAEKQTVSEKKPNLFVRAGRAIARFFRELKSECKKIVWPGFPSVVKNTIIVLVVCLVIGAGIWIVDFLLSQLLGLIAA